MKKRSYQNETKDNKNNNKKLKQSFRFTGLHFDYFRFKDFFYNIDLRAHVFIIEIEPDFLFKSASTSEGPLCVRGTYQFSAVLHPILLFSANPRNHRR